jgi:hypothetical protein
MARSSGSFTWTKLDLITINFFEKVKRRGIKQKGEEKLEEEQGGREKKGTKKWEKIKRLNKRRSFEEEA